MSRESGGAALIRRLEALGLEAWPCEESESAFGWPLCFAQGSTKRANSVQTSLRAAGDAGAGDLAERVEGAAQRYRDRGLVPIFKLTDASEPSGLDAALAERGYELVDPTSVMTASIAAAPRADGEPLSFERELSDSWLADFVRIGELDEDRRRELAGILTRIAPPRAFASLCESAGGETLAQGLAVLQDEHLFLGDIATLEAVRGRGLARRVVSGLLRWGAARGACVAWLQRVVANEPALALYQAFGFEEAYRYWYRVGRSAPGLAGRE